MDRDTPLYQRIYNELLAAIRRHDYPADGRLPSETDLCARYGVSRITVKHALNLLRDEGVIVRQRGRGSYVRQSLTLQDESSRSESGILGLIIPSFSESFGSLLIAGAEEACRQVERVLAVRCTGNDMGDESQAIAALLRAGAQGLLLMPQHNDYYNPDVLRLIVDGFPLVVVDREMKGVSAPFVGTDNFDGARRATARLLALGHRAIGFISTPVESASTLKARLSGFKTAYFEDKLVWNERWGLIQLRSSLPDQNSEEQRRADAQAIKRFMLRFRELSALFVTEYHLAQLVIEVADEMGIAIPGDLSLVGYDGPSIESGDRFMARIIQPEHELGKQSVYQLHRVMEGAESRGRMILESTFYEGESLASYREQD